MPRGAPDWVNIVQVAINVNGVPVAPASDTDYLVPAFGAKSTSANTYQVVKSITVNSGKVGILRAVEIACNNYGVALWQLVINGVTIFADVLLPESFTQEWPDIQLPAGAVIELSVKSDGTTTISAYGDFAYKEVG